LGLLERGEVLALDVLDQGDLEGGAIVELLDDDRHLVELRELRGAPAPLAGDDLIGVGGVGMPAHEERLEDALLADRIGEGAQRVVVEPASRLEAPGAQEADRQRLAAGALPIVRRVFLALLAEERRKSASEIAPLAFFAHRLIPLKGAGGRAGTAHHARSACSRRSTSLARW